MTTHPVFTDLVLHSDDDLAELLGGRIDERETIHAWPLSCVQAVRLDDGTRLAYKVQLPPTVEPEFYASASSSLLPGYRLLGPVGQGVAMVINWIDAPLLPEVARGDGLIESGREIISEIAAIRGDLPSYLDIGSVTSWTAVVDEVLSRREQLTETGWFTHPDHQAANRIRAWARSEPVVSAISAGSRVIHGDLTGGQVFVTESGYRVIDWQRPVIAPAEVDLVSLLVGSRVDPHGVIDDATVGIFWLLRLHWAVAAQYELFPDARRKLFDDWATEAVDKILQYAPQLR
jgi:hypothetical protein